MNSEAVLAPKAPRVLLVFVYVCFRSVASPGGLRGGADEALGSCRCENVSTYWEKTAGKGKRPELNVRGWRDSASGPSVGDVTFLLGTFALVFRGDLMNTSEFVQALY